MPAPRHDDEAPPREMGREGGTQGGLIGRQFPGATEVAQVAGTAEQPLQPGVSRVGSEPVERGPDR